MIDEMALDDEAVVAFVKVAVVDLDGDNAVTRDGVFVFDGFFPVVEAFLLVIVVVKFEGAGVVGGYERLASNVPDNEVLWYFFDFHLFFLLLPASLLGGVAYIL